MSLSLSLSLQPDGVTNISQGNTDRESETDQEVKAKKTANKVYRKVSEEDLNLEPLCEEVVNCCYLYQRGVL
jgi:twinkle protein